MDKNYVGTGLVAKAIAGIHLESVEFSDKAVNITQP